MTVGPFQELQWRKEIFLDDIVRKAAEDDYFHQMVTHQFARMITEERSGVMIWLYSYFSVLHKPMSPIEFYVFWESLDDIESVDFTMFAIRNMR